MPKEALRAEHAVEGEGWEAGAVDPKEALVVSDALCAILRQEMCHAL